MSEAKIEDLNKLTLAKAEPAEHARQCLNIAEDRLSNFSQKLWRFVVSFLAPPLSSLGCSPGADYIVWR